MHIVSLLLFLYAAIVSFFSLRRSRANQFYSVSTLAIPLGIYVWGDGLILGPFWMLLSVAFLFFSPQQILQTFLIFWMIRSFYETIYWISHQFTTKEYQGQIFRNVKWIKSHDSAILYQLLNMCMMIAALLALLYSS